MSIHSNAGLLPDEHNLVNLPRLVARYYSERPDPSDPAQQVAFGTSGHRGSSLKNSCLLYTSPSPRDLSTSRMPSSA